MRRFLTLTSLLCALCGCDSGNTGGNALKPDRLTFNDRTIELRSAISQTETDWELGKIWGIALYTQEYSSIPESEPSTAAYFILSERLLGKEIDLTKRLEEPSDLIEIEFRIEGAEYDIYRTGDLFEIWFGDEEVHESIQITSGTLKVEYGPDAVRVVAEVAFSDGKRLSAQWNGPFTGKSPSSDPETGAVFGTMRMDDLTSNLRSGLYASIDHPDLGEGAFLLLSPQSELNITDLSVDFDTATALVVQLPLQLFGRTIDLTQPLPPGTFDQEPLIYLCIDRYGLEIGAEAQGWVATDDNGDIPTARAVTEGTFEVTRTDDGNTLRLNAVLLDGTHIAAEWEGPVRDISEIAFPLRYEARRSPAPDASDRHSVWSLRPKNRTIR